MLFSRAAATVGIIVLSSAVLVPALSAPTKHKGHSSASSKHRKKDDASQSHSVHKALVKVSTARLRSSPDRKGHMTALLDAGRSAKVIDRKDGWAKVRLESGREGWVRHDLLSVSKKAVRDTEAVSKTASKKRRVASTPSKTKKVVKVAYHAPKQTKAAAALSQWAQKAKHEAAVAAQAERARKHQQNVAANEAKRAHATSAQSALHQQHLAEAALNAARRKANAHAAHLSRLAAQQANAKTRAEKHALQNAAALAVLDRAKELREARAADATDGESTTAPGITDGRADRLVRTALSYRGTPYRMGATGRGAFDCSGFTMYLFGKEGERLPRTAAEQYNHGTPVNKADMQIGDLVFFKNTYKRGVSHVGVYIGNGHFVHASSGSHQVTVTSLSSAYYVNHWAGARRPR